MKYWLLGSHTHSYASPRHMMMAMRPASEKEKVTATMPLAEPTFAETVTMVRLFCRTFEFDVQASP